MAYIYQADLWCDACGEQIKADIAREHPELVPEDPEDQGSYDSDDYPKEYDATHGESDGPHNCASGNCAGEYGTFLENQLTTEGYRYLKSMLDQHGETLPPAAEEWADFYGFAYFHNRYDSAHEWLRETLRGFASDDGLRGNPAAQSLWEFANEMAGKLDADTIQDLFQSDMDADDYFKATGWYSPEMGD